MLDRLTDGLMTAAEAGRLPDRLLSVGIRARLRSILRRELRGGAAAITERKQAMLDERANGPITTHVVDANRQHYEVPSDFFSLVLGPRLRYSCCYWPEGVDSLADAEEAALAQTVERAALVDGDRILELGAGWGSLSLYMAERFPNSQIVTVSNSRTQKQFIDETAASQQLDNLTVVTADIGEFAPEGEYDRVVSVEMFEHVRNHRELLRRIGTWLRPGGTLFVHVFTHHTVAWHYDAEADGEWMARHFFAGGTMPSDDLLLLEQRDLTVERQWRLDGSHYAKTAAAWLDRLDTERDACLAALRAGDDPTPAEIQLNRWRLFFLACVETWRLGNGTEFGVSHYRFTNPT